MKNIKIISMAIVFFTAIILPYFYLHAQNEQPQSKTNQVYVVKIDNYIINPVIVKFISNAIEQATANNAVCLIIELDTPGGLLESTRILVKNILNSEVPIITYISPSGSRAGSAGVFITYASHIASMAQSTNIGAAHPIGIGFIPARDKEDKDSESILNEKVMNDIVAWAEGIAKSRNRNVQWIKKSILESASVTEKEAIKQNIVNILAIDLQDLLNKIDGLKVETKHMAKTLSTKSAKINIIDMSQSEKILNTIIHPNVSYILMMLGIIGLIFEFSHPGIGFAGIAGLICMLLALYAFQVIPINYTGLSLIGLAVILFIAEAFTPTFGLLTLGGIVSFALGSLMLIKSPYPFLKISLNIIVPVIISVVAITLFLVTNAIKIHRKKVSTGKEGLIDKIATATTDINKKGKVFLHGEIWTAYNTEDNFIKKDEEVKVVRVEGLKLYIKKL